MKAAIKAIIDGLKEDETVRFKGQKLLIRAAYSGRRLRGRDVAGRTPESLPGLQD